MSPSVQAKFLGVLQERELQRLGGSQTLRADVCVIAATNRDPRIAMERGTLRDDLYYRPSAFEITVPPLRERPEDVLVLSEAFLDEIGRSVGRPAAGLSKDARDRLLTHAWPGNVRELRNAIERAVILCECGLITGEHLPIAVAGAARSRAASPAEPSPLPASLPSAGLPRQGVSLDTTARADPEGHGPGRRLRGRRRSPSLAPGRFGGRRGWRHRDPLRAGISRSHVSRARSHSVQIWSDMVVWQVW